MNRCQLVLSIGTFVFVTVATACTGAPKENQATLPGVTLSDGVLSFTGWDQQTVSENPQRNVISLQIENTGKSNESVVLKRLYLKLTEMDGTERSVEEKDIDVKNGNPVCVSVPIEAKLSKLEIQVEDSTRKYGPFIYDFASNKSGADKQMQTAHVDAIDVSTTELQLPKGKQCFVDTSLGCLYQIGKMRVEKLGKPATGPQNFVVLSFKGKGVLQFKREEFTITDAESNSSYQWSRWVYNGEMMFLPGFSGSFDRPDNGPALLQGCWHFEVLYEVPETVRRVKLDFKRGSLMGQKTLNRRTP